MTIYSFLGLCVEDVMDTLCPIGNLMKCGLMELSIISLENVMVSIVMVDGML